jgi:hypothetical protein
MQLEQRLVYSVNLSYTPQRDSRLKSPNLLKIGMRPRIVWLSILLRTNRIRMLPRNNLQWGGAVCGVLDSDI